MLPRSRFIFFAIQIYFFLYAFQLYSQDTLKITLKDAEKRFLDQNFDLLMAKTDIDQAKGFLLQAKLFQNPELNFNRELYGYKTREYFPGKPYQYEVDATQLITIAGKKIKRIQIAQQHVKLSEYEFYDVLRALKFDLKEKFYKLWKGQRKIPVVESGINELSKLIEATKIQVEVGNIARKELVRLQSLMLELMSNKSEILKDIAGNESEIKLLLNYRNKEYLVAQLNDSSSAALPPVETIIFDSIEQTAFVSRYDLQMAALEAELGKNELQLAKKEAIPDVNFGAQYDKFGTYNNGYMGLLIGLPLPLWNLNQGNVKAAKARYDQLTLARQKKELEVHVSLEEVYRSLLTEGQLYRAVSKDFQKSSDDIYKNIYESYKNRTIGLIEFLEYFESYKNTTFNFIEIETDFRIQLQRLNLEIGKDIY